MLCCSFTLLVLQRNVFDYLNGEYRTKKLSRFAKVSVCLAENLIASHHSFSPEQPQPHVFLVAVCAHTAWE